MPLLRSPAAFPPCPHAAAGMRWFRHLTAFLWHAALLAVSLAAEYQTDKFTVDRAFAEFIRRTRSHFCTSMSEQPNGETKPNYPAQRENVKDQLDRTHQESSAAATSAATMPVNEPCASRDDAGRGHGQDIYTRPGLLGHVPIVQSRQPNCP